MTANNDFLLGALRSYCHLSCHCCLDYYSAQS